MFAPEYRNTMKLDGGEVYIWFGRKDIVFYCTSFPHLWLTVKITVMWSLKRKIKDKENT